MPIWQLPGMRERTVIVNGFSKAYSVTGWRLGYVVAAAPLTKAIRKAHHFLVLGSAHPLQLGAVEAISSQEDYYRNLRRDYAARLTVLQTGLDALAIPYLAPEGGYFILADFSGWGWRDDLEFAKTLTSQAGVSARPLSGFNPADSQPDGSLWLRLAFCKQEQVLAEAVKRLQQFSHLKRKG